MLKRLMILTFAVLAITMAMGGLAFAATWQDIHTDLQDGSLDGRYTADELRDYLYNATEGEYNQIVQDRLDQLTDSVTDRDTFPFTGFQMMIAGVVAVVLVGGGIALRRFSRT
jgi:hypothetical protein